MSAVRTRIVELYGPSILRKSALNIRGGAGVFESVMAGKGIRTALEIGTYRGVAAAEMAQYCEHVITIDLEYGKLEQNGDDFDRRLFWHSLGIENVTFLPVRDDAHKKTVIDALDFDFAFIDGAHDQTVANDFALVKRCGRVLFHDYDRRGRPELDFVCDFVDTLPQDQITKHDIFALWQEPGGTYG
jgi:predicted O-methyltransferase YrrM